MNDTNSSNSGSTIAAIEHDMAAVQSYDPNNIPLPAAEVVFEAKGSDENTGNNFASFESNALKNFVDSYRNIKVSSVRDDDLDRVYYYIDTNNATPLTIMKFETTTGTLLSINGVVISLYRFLDIAHIETSETEEKKMAVGGDFRDFGKKRPDLICTTHDDFKFKITNASIPAITMALSILTKEENDNYTGSDYSSEYSTDADDADNADNANDAASHNRSVGNSETAATSNANNRATEVGLIRSIFRALW